MQILAAGVGLLAIAHLLGQYSIHVLNRSNVYGLIDRFHLDGEANVPSWYAGLLLLACALVFLLIAVSKWQESDRFARHWAGLAVIAAIMCFDEGAQFHEMLTRPTREFADGTGGWLRSYWVVPGTILALIVGLAYLRFLRHLPRAVAARFLAAGGIFLAGAIGLESVGGWYITSRGTGVGYHLIAGTEEVLEKVGVLVALNTALAYLANQTPAIRLALRPDAAPSQPASLAAPIRIDARSG